MRSIAPTEITLDAITLDAASGVKNGINVSLGTTRLRLRKSTLKGVLAGVPLYLNAESRGRIIVDNMFDVGTSHRE